MARRIDGHVGGHLAVIPDLHLRHVDDGAVVVGEKVFPNLDVEAVIAVKGRVDECSLRFSQQLPHDRRDLLKIRPVRKIEPLQDPPALLLLLHDGRVRNVSHFRIPSRNVVHLLSFLSPGETPFFSEISSAKNRWLPRSGGAPAPSGFPRSRRWRPPGS